MSELSKSRDYLSKYNYDRSSISSSMPARNVSYSTNPGIDVFKDNYHKFDHFDHKKQMVDELLSKRASEKEFSVGMEYLIQEPDDSPYRLQLFSYFINRFKEKEGLRILSVKYLDHFARQTENMEYLAIMIRAALRETTDRYFRGEISKLLVGILHNMDMAKIKKKFYLDDVERFLGFKQNNRNLDYNLAGEKHVSQLKQKIDIMYYGIIEHVITTDAPHEKICPILLDWLLVLSPLAVMDEYNLMYNIARSLVDSCKSTTDKYNEAKCKRLILSLLELLRIKYMPNDDYKGYRNLVIVFELLEPSLLGECINDFFPEIVELMEEKQVLMQVLYNMVNANITQNTCHLIYLLSENFKLNKMFDQLYAVFQNIVLPHLLPKLRVARSFTANIKVCKFYFYGFASMKYNLNEVVIGHMLANLKFMCINAYKDTKLREYLHDYLNFLDIVVAFYEHYSQEKAWFATLKQYIDEIRKEFSFTLSEREYEKIVSEAQKFIWDLTPDEISGNVKSSFTDALLLKFRTNKKYKGIKNIGNTCYMNSTMQALFMTLDFRVRMIELKEYVPRNLSSDKQMAIEEDIVKETQSLFMKMLSEEEAVDPSSFKPCLPEPFSNSKTEQDAYEFLTRYLDCLENALKYSGEIKDLVDECFAGEHLYTYECAQCQKKFTQKQKFLNLNLGFVENKPNDQIEMIKREYESEAFEKEVDCENCKTKSALMIRATDINKLPPYLIILLNRFKYVEQKEIKIFDYCQIYEYLNLRDILKDQKHLEDSEYVLYAVIVHVGSSTETGHYYTIIRDNENINQWFVMNDSLVYVVDKMDLTEVFKEYEGDTPYLLFYQKNSNKKQRYI